MNDRRLTGVLLALFMAVPVCQACGREAATTEAPTPAERPSPGPQAPSGGDTCHLAVDGGIVTIDGREVTGVDAGDASVSAVRFGDAVVMGLQRPATAGGGPAPTSEELLRVECGATQAVVWHRSDGADFGRLARHPAGLLYAAPEGIMLLREGAKAPARWLASPASPEGCEGPTSRLELPSAQGGGALLEVVAWDRCGKARDWLGRVMHVGVNATPPRVTRPVPIRSLVQRGQNVWLTVGGSCDRPGIVGSAPRGALPTSTDGGKTFRLVETGPLKQPVRDVVLDGDKALWALTARCRIGATPAGGVLGRTDDGASWRVVELPIDEPVTAIRGHRGNGQLFAWTASERRFLTRDRGVTWTELSRSSPPTHVRPKPLTLGAAQLLPTREGLMRREAGRFVRVFP